MSSSIRAEARRARAMVPCASESTSISVSSSSRHSDTDVSGFFRSWLTCPAKASSRSLERSSRSLTSVSRREAS